MYRLIRRFAYAKRDEWHDPDGRSLFQRTMEKLNRGNFYNLRQDHLRK